MTHEAPTSPSSGSSLHNSLSFPEPNPSPLPLVMSSIISFTDLCVDGLQQIADWRSVTLSNLQTTPK